MKPGRSVQGFIAYAVYLAVAYFMFNSPGLKGTVFGFGLLLVVILPGILGHMMDLTHAVEKLEAEAAKRYR